MRDESGGRVSSLISLKALDELVEPDTRGDPMSPLRWTCKSTRSLANELKSQGFVISSVKVGELLKLQGYSLQSNRKTRWKASSIRTGTHSSDTLRNAFEDLQSAVVNRRCRSTPRRKKTWNLKNAGKTYRRQGEPVKVKTHDFPDKELGKAVPYGVYDI